MARNYEKEYLYQGSPEQLKKRASRNSARAAMVKAGKAKPGDGKDVAHSNGNAKDNRLSNLKMQSKAANRSYPRTKTAAKKNPRD
jgi:hypothetical protein